MKRRSNDFFIYQKLDSFGNNGVAEERMES